MPGPTTIDIAPNAWVRVATGIISGQIYRILPGTHYRQTWTEIDGAAPVDPEDGDFLTGEFMPISAPFPGIDVWVYCHLEPGKIRVGNSQTLIGPDAAKKLGVDAFIQDQHTEVVDFLLTELIEELTLTTPAAIDDRSVTGDVLNTPPAVGNIVCLKENLSFYQGEILEVQDNGNDSYTLTVDAPVDAPFTVDGGCSIRNQNMAVAGSIGTPRIFSVGPGRLAPSTSWDITRFAITFVGPGGAAQDPTPDDTYFGTQLAIVNGITLRTTDGNNKNIFTVRNNAQLKLRCAGDLDYTPANKNGDFSAIARRTFSGKEKNGVTLRLDNDPVPADADRFEVIVVDDLTAHSFINGVAQGHVVD